MSLLTFESVSRNLKDLKLCKSAGEVSTGRAVHANMLLVAAVRVVRQRTHPLILSIPLFFPKPGFVYANAPPKTTIELSTPLGFPCRTFSETNAHLLISSATLGGIARRPSCDTCVCPGSLALGMRRRSGNRGMSMRW